MDIQNVITSRLADNLANRFDEIIIEGLKLKGHEFDNKQELEAFIKQRCKCIDDFIDEIKFYYVDGNPFLEHHYKQKPFEFTSEENKIMLTASMGNYRFV